MFHNMKFFICGIIGQVISIIIFSYFYFLELGNDIILFWKYIAFFFGGFGIFYLYFNMGKQKGEEEDDYD